MLPKILLLELTPYTDKIAGDHLCIFRRHRSTTDRIVTLFIVCIFIELNCSFVAPNNAALVLANTVLYCCYVFQFHLHHPQGRPHQNLKLYII
jgi:hypothetical protein